MYSLVVPRRAGEAVLPHSRPEISGSPDGWQLRMRVADHLYTGEWRMDRLAICHGDMRSGQ